MADADNEILKKYGIAPLPQRAPTGDAAILAKYNIAPPDPNSLAPKGTTPEERKAYQLSSHSILPSDEDLAAKGTAVKNAANTTGLGYYPEVAAGVKTGAGFLGDYTKQRQKEYEDLAAQSEKYPDAAMLGKVVGIGGSMAVNPLAKAGSLVPEAGWLAKILATRTGRMLAGALGYGGYAAAANPGNNKPGEVGLQLPERMADVKTAFTENPKTAIAATVLPGILAPNNVKTLENLSDTAGVVHMRPTPKIALSLGPERLKEIARENLNSGVVKFGAKAEDSAARAEQARLAAGKVMGDFIDASNTKVDPKSVADQIDEIAKQFDTGTEVDKGIQKMLRNKKQVFLDHYAPELNPEIAEHLPPDRPPSTMSARNIEDAKKAEQGDINYNNDPKRQQEAKMAWASLLRKEGEKAVGNPDFIPAKRTAGNLAASESMLDKKAALTNNGSGLVGQLADLGIGMEAIKEMANGNPMGGPLGLAHILTRKRLSSMAQVGLNKIANGGPAIGQAGAIPGVKQGADIWTRLMQQGLLNRTNLPTDQQESYEKNYICRSDPYGL